MFKCNGKYYICASDLYGWNASNVYYLESDSIYGPYTPTNSMLKMSGAADDYGHVTQTGFFVTVKGSEQETVVYCGDRWAGFAGNGNGFNQWCPISFVDGKPYFNSLSQWSLDATTGLWEVGPDNNYVRNFSFDADRVKIPSTSKPAQTYIKGWNFEVVRGNAILQGGEDSPVLNASNSVSDRAYVMGNYCLNVTDKVDFARRIYQTVASTPSVELSDGLYTLTAKVKCGSAFSELYMYATVGDETIKADITYSDGVWHTIAIEDLAVRGGRVEVGFYADGAADAWVRFDDVSLVMTEPLPTSAVKGTTASRMSDDVKFYSLSGRAVASPQHGVFVKREVCNGNIVSRLILKP